MIKKIKKWREILFINYSYDSMKYMKQKQKTFLKDIWDVIKFTFVVLIIIIPIRMFIAQPFIVSGQSMLPNFHNGDYLIVNEIVYKERNPKRGEIIVFRLPYNHHRFLIKRVVGLPGETIKIQNGIVTIITKDGKTITLDEPYIREPFKSFGEWKLKNDEYFVMGDNRNNSSDSRVWGALKRNLIVGTPLIRLFPIKDIKIHPGDDTSKDKES